MRYIINVGYTQSEFFAWRLTREQWAEVIAQNDGEEIQDVENWVDLVGGYMEPAENFECEFQDYVLMGGTEAEDSSYVEDEDGEEVCDFSDSISCVYDEDEIEDDGEVYAMIKYGELAKQIDLACKNDQVLVVLRDVQKPGIPFEIDIDDEFDLSKLQLEWEEDPDEEPVFVGATYDGQEAEWGDFSSTGTKWNRLYIYNLNGDCCCDVVD